jgi:hypothetical protein
MIAGSITDTAVHRIKGPAGSVVLSCTEVSPEAVERTLA